MERNNEIDITSATAAAIVAENRLGSAVILSVGHATDNDIDDAQVPLTAIESVLIEIPQDGQALLDVISGLIQQGILRETAGGLSVTLSEFGRTIYTILKTLGDMEQPTLE